jgi:hypothetical protein
MNVPEIVIKVQNVNHIFSEVTDILVYIGWIIIILIYFISSIQWQTSSKKSRMRTNRKSNPFVSLFIVKKTREENFVGINHERLTNKQRHNDVSLIILSIGLLSIILYFPVMTNKFTTMNLTYLGKTFLTDRQIIVLQILQQTTHLFCLTIRFIPYFIFDKRICSFLHEMIGMKILKKQSPMRKEKRLQKYICHCQCSRRQESIELNDNQSEHQTLQI